MPEPKVCAVFLFNHKYERNVDKLEALYADRFEHRRYIMPFASRDDAQILRVYERATNFSGHIAQAARGFVMPGVTHYAIIADDLILNPRLDERSLVPALGLGADTGYIKSLAGSDALRFRWPWSGESAMAARMFGRTFDYRAELPPAAEAQARFEAMGLAFPRPLPRKPRDLAYTFWTLPRSFPWPFLMGLGMMGRPAPYPLLSGYSDFVVVPAAAIDRFVHYCGVFAAMNLFAEVAVPTALALACDRVVTELAPGWHFVDPAAPRMPEARLEGVEYWTGGEADAFAARFDHSIARLRAEFPEDLLYVHPAKLSRWR